MAKKKEGFGGPVINTDRVILRPDEAIVLRALEEAKTTLDPLVREAHHGDSYLEANNMLAVVEPHIVHVMNHGVFFCLAMIIMKTCRAFNDPTHMDNWIDIIGYATLAKNRMERRNSNAISSEGHVRSSGTGRRPDGS